MTNQLNLKVCWLRSLTLFVCTLTFSCASLPPIEEVSSSPFQPKNFNELKSFLLNRKPDLKIFRKMGPFQTSLTKNFDIRISTEERINSDLVLSQHDDKAPLVIILHGNDSWKEAHTFQAIHLASWGIHTLAIQLPNSGQWPTNGKSLAKLANFIYRWSEIVDQRIDVNKIILVGHSFGGSAVAVALGEGAPVSGGIFLDPAIVSKEIPKYLKQISTPTMLLGADEEVFQARLRKHFFKNIRNGIAEVSIKDSTHQDAQFPSETALNLFGFDPFTSEELQITFTSAITASAFSLGSTGKFDYAWESFGDDIKTGKFLNARKK